MANKFFMKKSWVNVDMCIEDYYNSGTVLSQAKENLNWSPYSNIIGKEVKFQRNNCQPIPVDSVNNLINFFSV